MIHQVAHVKTKTGSLPAINQNLLKARHIQAHVKEKSSDESLPTEVYLWSPLTAGPYLVPVTRWIE